MLTDAGGTGHAARPTSGAIYSWKSMPACGDGHGGYMPGEFPLLSVCPECGQPVKRRNPHDVWQHDDTPVDGPADADSPRIT